MNANEITLQLVDDHELIRRGFKSIIEAISNYKVVVESASAEEAWRDYLKFKPDIVITDISMPGIGGIEGIKRILSRDKDAKIIVLTMHGKEMGKHVIKLGVKAYINKSDPPTMILKAIQTIMNKNLNGRPTSVVSKPDATDIFDPFESLTKREFEVAMLILSEKTNNRIADILGLSPKTIHVHKRQIFQKLNISSMVGLTYLAITHHMIEFNPCNALSQPTFQV
ncbi:MAG: response regulator transcription factor [Mariprofundaceae bacterium]